MVVLDRQDYINKAMHLFAQRDTCRHSTADPIKKQLSNMLRTTKAGGGLGDSTYETLCPTSRDPPNSVGYLKFR